MEFKKIKNNTYNKIMNSPKEESIPLIIINFKETNYCIHLYCTNKANYQFSLYHINFLTNESLFLKNKEKILMYMRFFRQWK